jgi:beta-xylosidase
MRRIVLTALLPSALLLAGEGPGHAGTYANPVLVETHGIRRGNPAPSVGTLGIGDPAVLEYGDRYYLYPTGDNHGYDVYVSDDLVHWEKGPKVFQSGEIGFWAPEVFFSAADATFYLYYTVKGRIGVAASDRPDGAFADRGSLIANGIDAHLFRDDDGSFYLYYARYPDFAIFVQPMRSPVGTEGAPVELIAPSEAWETRGVTRPAPAIAAGTRGGTRERQPRMDPPPP